MTVYLLVDFDYVVAAYSTKEAADQALRTNKDISREYASVQEFEVQDAP